MLLSSVSSSEPNNSMIGLFSERARFQICTYLYVLRRGTMTAACAGALVNLIVVLREEGERAAAEDSHLERDEREGGSSRCCCATARTRRPGDARGDPGESVCTPVDCS